ncbi:tetratricopeptide repeat protein [Hyalangium versicolor]|uniref:tetratricopeptide repeat protein n=1 Tax=Hyalangium versicolor TaxID=2861190 RepID=UPI001CCA4A7F|nr:hypothetical protein [Hyalangium versicolor]
MIQDPAGLVQRIPELKPLCEDPGVLRAVERGDPFQLYRALFWARWLGRLRSHRELIDALLRQRRLFARPIKGNLFLGTLNGFGATLLGDADKDAHDGTHIATHCLVALFVIPLLPLGAYVVRPSQESNMMRRGWTIFARVPLGPLPWLFSRALALGVIALVMLGALKAYHDSRYQDLRVINGFGQSVRVELAGLSRTVPPHGMIILNSVPFGRQTGRALTEGGAEVSTAEIDVSSGFDVLAWNIAGAAPVYFETVVYRASSSGPPPESKPELYCGRELVSVRDVDYAFQEPPESLKMSSSTSRLSKTHVGIAPQQSADPVPLCLRLLASQNQLANAGPLIEASARASGWEQATTYQLLELALLAEPSEALRIARLGVQARPEDLELHRAYQWVGERTGSHGALLEEYRARAEAQPDSAVAQYLHARLKTGRDGLTSVEQLAQRFPQEPAILRALIYNRSRTGNWKGTVEAWETLRKLSAEDATDTAQMETTALLALGRRGEALELLKQLFSEAPALHRPVLAALYARVAHTEGSQAADELISAIEAEDRDSPGEKSWFLRAYAGLPIEGAPDRPSLLLMSTVSRNPHTALEHAARLNPSEVQNLRHDVWALAYGEAVRTHATDSEKALFQAYVLDTQSIDLFRRFVLGEPVSLDEAELDPEVRAAACFVRSRNTSLSAQERRQLVEQARQDDWLHGSVSEAIASWEP